MSGMEYLLATTLLIAPPGTPEPPIPANQWLAMQSAIHQVAIEWQIMDEREKRHLVVRPNDFLDDLELLRRRYQELLDAPMLSDCGRFPNRSDITQSLTFNRKFAQHLENQRSLQRDRSGLYERALSDTKHLYQVYDAVRDAQCDFYYVTVRRAALKKLRELVGREAYYAGQLPPAVPVWHFRQRR